jgi:helix-turn-helix protein
MSAVPAPLPALDPAQRYTVEETIRYLRSSRVSVYKLFDAGRLHKIKQGRRTFVSGAEIAELSKVPEAAA